jgi:Domain of unknown function (DUF4190)
MMPGRPNPYGYGPPPQPPAPHDRPGYRPYDGTYGFGEPMVPQATDHRAALSLALGVLSITCGGLFLGIPAVLFGFSARKHIRASGGMTTGTGLATGGIVTGFVGTAVSLLVAGAFVVSAILSPPGAGGHVSYGSPPRAHTTSPHGTTAPTPHRATIGAVDVVNLSSDDGPLREQLALELTRARASKRTLVVQTTATWANVCAEIDDALTDTRMQTALADVQLVRVDVDEFRAELSIQHMYEGSVPWFYKIDSTVQPTDAISGDEWDDNTPENMAPVLKAFAAGTLKARRHASTIGTPL